MRITGGSAIPGGIHWLNSIVIFAVNLFYLWLLLGLDLSRLNWPTASLSVVLMAISAAAFGLFIGNFAILTKDSIYGQILGRRAGDKPPRYIFRSGLFARIAYGLLRVT